MNLRKRGNFGNDNYNHYRRRYSISVPGYSGYSKKIQINMAPALFRGFSMEGETMKKWIFTASTDGNMIDFETAIESDTEPDFWTCYNLATEHECSFFNVMEA